MDQKCSVFALHRALLTNISPPRYCIRVVEKNNLKDTKHFKPPAVYRRFGYSRILLLVMRFYGREIDRRVGFAVEEGFGVGVSDAVGVLVGGFVCVAVRVSVRVRVFVRVRLLVAVRVAVLVAVLVRVLVIEGVCVGVWVATSINSDPLPATSDR
jgi:hypothetical protein